MTAGYSPVGMAGTSVTTGGPVMMVDTTVHPTSRLLFEAVGPALNDDQTNLVLLAWLDGVGRLLGRVDDVVRADGWRRMVDPGRTDPGWLPWLGLWVGVRVDGLASVGLQRAQVVGRSGAGRGTAAALVAAVRETLSGDRSVLVVERADDDVALVRVTLLASEVESEVASEVAVRSVLPAGLLLDLQVVSTQTYAELAAEFGTYAGLAAEFGTYADVKRWDPPEVEE